MYLFIANFLTRIKIFRPIRKSDVTKTAFYVTRGTLRAKEIKKFAGDPARDGKSPGIKSLNIERLIFLSCYILRQKLTTDSYASVTETDL